MFLRTSVNLAVKILRGNGHSSEFLKFASEKTRSTIIFLMKFHARKSAQIVKPPNMQKLALEVWFERPKMSMSCANWSLVFETNVNFSVYNTTPLVITIGPSSSKGNQPTFPKKLSEEYFCVPVVVHPLPTKTHSRYKDFPWKERFRFIFCIES